MILNYGASLKNAFSHLKLSLFSIIQDFLVKISSIRVEIHIP